MSNLAPTAMMKAISEGHLGISLKGKAMSENDSA